MGALALGDAVREEINLWNEVDRKIIPRKNSVYVKGYRNFRKLYDNTKDIMKEIDN